MSFKNPASNGNGNQETDYFVSDGENEEMTTEEAMKDDVSDLEMTEESTETEEEATEDSGEEGPENEIEVTTEKKESTTEAATEKKKPTTEQLQWQSPFPMTK